MVSSAANVRVIYTCLSSDLINCGSAGTGTDGTEECFSRMYEPLPILVENSLHIAWDFPERDGDITDPGEAS